MKLLTAALATALLLGSSPLLQAEGSTVTAKAESTAEAKSSQRKTHVNRRLSDHNKKIRKGIKKGTMTQNEGNAISEKDKAIRVEKNDMEEKNDGQLSKNDHKKLNSKLNDTGKEIHETNKAGEAK